MGYKDIRVEQIAEALGFDLEVNGSQLIFRRRVTLDDGTEDIDERVYTCMAPKHPVGPTYDYWLEWTEKNLLQLAMHQDGVSEIPTEAEPPWIDHVEVNRLMREALRKQNELENLRYQQQMYQQRMQQRWNTNPLPTICSNQTEGWDYAQWKPTIKYDTGDRREAA